MTYNENIYTKLYKTGKFTDQIAYGLYAANAVKFIKKLKEKHEYISDSMMDSFYMAEEAHLQDYEEAAAAQIEQLSKSISEDNADKLLAKVAEKVNGKHPRWVNFGINLLSALVWDIILLGLGLMAIWKFDAVAQIAVEMGRTIIQNR